MKCLENKENKRELLHERYNLLPVSISFHIIGSVVQQKMDDPWRKRKTMCCRLKPRNNLQRILVDTFLFVSFFWRARIKTSNNAPSIICRLLFYSLLSSVDLPLGESLGYEEDKRPMMGKDMRLEQEF